MSTSLISAPAHALFTFLITAKGTIVQMHFQNSSPLDEYPANIWIFIICSLFYCLAFGYNIKCQICPQPNPSSLNRSVKAALISASLAYTALLSVLLPPSLQPLAFIVCLMLLFVYFNRKKIAEIGDGMASYLCDLWTTTKSRASSLCDGCGRNDGGGGGADVPARNRPPV